MLHLIPDNGSSQSRLLGKRDTTKEQDRVDKTGQGRAATEAWAIDGTHLEPLARFWVWQRFPQSWDEIPSIARLLKLEARDFNRASLDRNTTGLLLRGNQIKKQARPDIALGAIGLLKARLSSQTWPQP